MSVQNRSKSIIISSYLALLALLCLPTCAYAAQGLTIQPTIVSLHSLMYPFSQTVSLTNKSDEDEQISFAVHRLNQTDSFILPEDQVDKSLTKSIIFKLDNQIITILPLPAHTNKQIQVTFLPEKTAEEYYFSILYITKTITEQPLNNNNVSTYLHQEGVVSTVYFLSPYLANMHIEAAMQVPPSSLVDQAHLRITLSNKSQSFAHVYTFYQITDIFGNVKYTSEPLSVYLMKTSSRLKDIKLASGGLLGFFKVTNYIYNPENKEQTSIQRWIFIFPLVIIITFLLTLIILGIIYKRIRSKLS